MARQTIGKTRLAQRTAAAKMNANFNELYLSRYVLAVEDAAAAGSVVVPAGYKLDSIVFFNNTANAVTGGIKVGTTNGGTDIVTAQAVAANALVDVASASISKKIFSTTAPQTVYYDAVTGWNSAVVDIRITISKVF